MLAHYVIQKIIGMVMAAMLTGQAAYASALSAPGKVNEFSASAISVSSIKAEWNGENGEDYSLSITPIDKNTGYTENIRIRFVGNSKAYITGLREGSEYEIVVKELDIDGKPIDSSAATQVCNTESVEVIEEFEYEDGWTNCFAYEHAGGLTLDPSWSAIQNCSVDTVTGTGIMRDEYGDYCCAMGTVYGYCGDRFLITLQNGVQFTVKICDSKGDRTYHSFGGDGKCIVEFIHADGCLPGCVSFSGNYGSYSWDGLIFDNIQSIKKINYGEKVEY